MEHVIGILDNAALQGLAYGIAVIGVALAFRVLRYPDLTSDGSFLMGASVFGSLVLANWPWALAMLAAVVAGAGTGGITALLHTKAGVNRLLSGILTAMICYSMAFWVLSGRSNLNLTQQATIFSWADQFDRDADWAAIGFHGATILVSSLVTFAVIGLTVGLLRSDFGVVLRATGQNESLVEGLGRRPGRYYTVGLMIANGLIGLAGSLVASRQGFADVNMGIGVIVTLVAALVIGEEMVRLFGLDPGRTLIGRALSGVVGACMYFLLYLVILRVSILGWLPIRIQPTDLKLMSAVIVVVFVVIRNRTRPRGAVQEEMLPI